MAQPKIKLTYFDIEGAAEKVRLAFVLGGIEWEDDRISFADWGALKPTTKYGQVPLMTIDGGAPIAQSDAMMRYAAALSGGSLYPADKLLQIEEVVGLAGDLSRTWAPCLYLGMRPHVYGYPEGYNKTEEGKAKVKEMRENFAANELPRFLTYFEDFLKESGGPFMCGANPTIADCVLLPILRNWTKGHVDDVPVTCLETHPAIVAYVQAMLDVPAIKAWYGL